MYYYYYSFGKSVEIPLGLIGDLGILKNNGFYYLNKEMHLSSRREYRASEKWFNYWHRARAEHNIFEATLKINFQWLLGLLLQTLGNE